MKWLLFLMSIVPKGVPYGTIENTVKSKCQKVAKIIMGSSKTNIDLLGKMMYN